MNILRAVPAISFGISHRATATSSGHFEDPPLSDRSDVNEENDNKAVEMGSFDVWTLGITVVIGGQYFCWNAGLIAGFGTYFIAFVFITSLYFFLILGNAELCSAFPFTGGAYGLGRLTLGLYWGFVVACCEAIEYILYVASSAITLADMVVSISGVSDEYMLLYTFFFYITALFIHIKGGSVFSKTNAVLAIISIFALLLYCFGGFQYANFKQNAPDPSTTGANEKGYFIGGISSFMKVYPLAAWFYVGVESLNLATVFVPEPRTMVPKGAIACLVTLIVTGVLVIFICSSIPPIPPDDDTLDITPTSASLAPLNPVFVRMLGISDTMATVISIPATYATAYGFIFAYGRLILSMARSDLFPPIFKATYGPSQTPYVAYIAGSVIGYAICVVVYFYNDVLLYLFNICMLSGFMEYLSQFIGYIIFLKDYGTQERSFHSPFGVYGAIYGIFVTLIGIIAIIGFQDDNYIAFISFILIFTAVTLYYHLYAKYHQQFSAEERFLYFKCHVRDFNKKKNNGLKKRRGSGGIKSVRMSERVKKGSAMMMSPSLITLTQALNATSCKESVISPLPEELNENEELDTPFPSPEFPDTDLKYLSLDGVNENTTELYENIQAGVGADVVPEINELFMVQEEDDGEAGDGEKKDYDPSSLIVQDDLVKEFNEYSSYNASKL